MSRLIFFRRHSQKMPHDAHIPVWPLWLILITACLGAFAIAARLDSSILSVSHFPL